MLEAIAYTKVNGFLNFSNILTCVLFFVPRSIWLGKNVPSGQLIAEFFRGHFTNLSCPFVAEFYLSFGIVGLILLSFLLGYVFYKLECMINSRITFKKGISMIVFGMLIYLLRGALLPTFSYTMSLIVSFVVCYYIFYFLSGLRRGFNGTIKW